MDLQYKVAVIYACFHETEMFSFCSPLGNISPDWQVIFAVSQYAYMYIKSQSKLRDYRKKIIHGNTQNLKIWHN